MKKRILIVEDDKKIAGALGLRLRAKGYDVTIVFDALGGVNAARKLQPDLVLLDISMPGGGGLLAAERIGNLVHTAGTPIIFMTASQDPSLRSKAMEMGPVGFLEKPFEPEALLSLIATGLGETPEEVSAES